MILEVSIDDELLNEAKQKIPNLDEFIETQIRLELLDDFSEEIEILKIIADKINELKILETKLVRTRESRLNILDDSIFDVPLQSLSRINNNLGMVGKNQIKKFSKIYKVPYDSLLEHSVECGLNVVNYAETPK